MVGSQVASWPKGIGAITLFVEDLAAAKQFYREVFGLSVTFEDDDSAVFDFGNTIINLLTTTAARELIEPAPTRCGHGVFAHTSRKNALKGPASSIWGLWYEASRTVSWAPTPSATASLTARSANPNAEGGCPPFGGQPPATTPVGKPPAAMAPRSTGASPGQRSRRLVSTAAQSGGPKDSIQAVAASGDRPVLAAKLAMNSDAVMPGAPLYKE